jgi:16S rRNA processing protein RimM
VIDRLAVGKVVSTHGVNGELKVRSLSGSLEHLVALKEAAFRKDGVEKVLRLTSARAAHPDVLVKISGIDTPEKARGLVGAEIWVPRSQATPLSAGEYYMADLCQCDLYWKEELIGRVRSVMEAGGTQLLEVETVQGATRLVPFTDHFIAEVEVEKGRVFLREDEIVR